MAIRAPAFLMRLLVLYIILRYLCQTVLSLSFPVDTPDPYVKLYIKTAPNGKRKTKVRNNSANPIWEEVFHFYLDPDMTNNLGESATWVRYMLWDWRWKRLRETVHVMNSFLWILCFFAIYHCAFYYGLKLPLCSTFLTVKIHNSIHYNWRSESGKKLQKPTFPVGNRDV